MIVSRLCFIRNLHVAACDKLAFAFLNCLIGKYPVSARELFVFSKNLSIDECPECPVSGCPVSVYPFLFFFFFLLWWLGCFCVRALLCFVLFFFFFFFCSKPFKRSTNTP